ncbi:MAG: hypothetical protein Tsb0020_09640 [Haliangiales bacterium]
MSLGVAMAQAGCGGGGDLVSCVSSYDGSLRGDVISGPLIAQLTIDMSPGIPDDEREGTLTVLLDPEEEGRNNFIGTARVSPADGTLDPGSSSLALMGTFDFDSCSISGDFAIGNAASGTWELDTREPGLF